MPVPPAPSDPSPPHTLATFLLRACRDLSYLDLLNIRSPSDEVTEPSLCPICYTHLIALLPESPALQIALPTCSHIFCAQCVSRHVLAGRNTCPLCRAVWFDIPRGATTAVSAAREADDRVMALQSMVAVLTEEVQLLADELDSLEIERSAGLRMTELLTDELNSFEMGGGLRIPESQVVVLDDALRRRTQSVERRRSTEEVAVLANELDAAGMQGGSQMTYAQAVASNLPMERRRSARELVTEMLTGVVLGLGERRTSIERHRDVEVIRDQYAGETPGGSGDRVGVGSGSGELQDGETEGAQEIRGNDGNDGNESVWTGYHTTDSHYEGGA